MDYKKTNAARTTISRDVQNLANNVGGNIYELITILKKRSNQIGVEIKEELIGKLEEFATPSDTLEEVFENQEQTEISRFYERLPKPTLIAIQELLEDQIYIREKVKEEKLDLDTDELIDLVDDDSKTDVINDNLDSNEIKSENSTDDN